MRRPRGSCGPDDGRFPLPHLDWGEGWRKAEGSPLCDCRPSETGREDLTLGSTAIHQNQLIRAVL